MRNYNRLLFVLFVIKLVIPFFLQDSFYQPHRDEYLYLAEGHHMAWGFMEVPPMISVFAWISNAFGATMFWIKIWPALFGAFTFLLIGKIIFSLGGRSFALFLGWFPFMLDGYMRLFFLFHPNFLDVFFWTLMAFCLVRYVQSQRQRWLYLFGISLGLGMMSKYSVAFYSVSLLAGILMTKQRTIFLNKHFYFACIIAFIIFLPNQLWQYQHQFPIVDHMRELQKEQLQYINHLDFVISQFEMNLPCVFIWITGLLFVILPREGQPYRLFGWAYFFVIVLLILLHGKPYYALGAYPVLFAFGAVYLEQKTAVYFKWTRYAMIIFAVTLGLFSMPLVMPMAGPQQLAKYYAVTGLNKTGDFRWEDLQTHPLPQDFADMVGWKEMAMKTLEVYHELQTSERNNTLIYCRGYYSAGALNYFGKEIGLPEVYSDNASFLFWMPEKFHVRNLILVAHRIPGKDDLVFMQFGKMSIRDSLNYPLARENGMKIILYENGNDSLNNMIERSVEKLKSKYLR